MNKIIACILFLCCTVSINIAQTDFPARLSEAAIALTKQKVVYDPAYFKIGYPDGDVPKDKGVCTDVVIRAYRRLGIDLQKNVHEDMQKNFNKYPKNWGLKTTDTNIDHRRVPNLMVYFSRYGEVKQITGLLPKPVSHSITWCSSSRVLPFFSILARYMG